MSFKNTFQPDTFAANTFASGTFRGARIFVATADHVTRWLPMRHNATHAVNRSTTVVCPTRVIVTAMQGEYRG